MFEDLKQVATAAGALTARLARHFHAGHARQFFHCLNEFEVAVLHQKTDGAAVSATTKTMEELFIAADGEGRGFFAVEGA